jgi:hypothetical protein
MQGGVKRAMLNLQDILGSTLDGVCDGVAMSRAQD